MSGGRVIIVGLGSPVRTDDGVGNHVVRRLIAEGLPDGVVAEEAGTAGVAILELIQGYDRAVIVDAIDAGEAPGTVLELGLDDLERLAPLHAASSHDADLATVLELGRRLDLALPDDVSIVAVQIADISTFGEQCTPPVHAAIAEACRLALALARGRKP